jgi:hypothetical protein
MKTKLLPIAISACSLLLTIQTKAATNFVVHEWGTFTSVQGAKGDLLPWHSLQTSELPGFVYDWTKPGNNRRSMAMFSKVVLETLQRMETPVIYFYADQPMNVDVDVAFPKGSITEWYPQATQIGPSFVADTNGSSAGILRESRIIWRNLQLVPEAQADNSTRLSQDASGSHYFAARETAANFVRADFTTPTNHTTELEKFLFYRGAGSFKTPLHVTIDSNNVVAVENTGAQLLAHLFLLSIHDGRGSFGVMDELSPSNSVTWLPLSPDNAEHWHQFSLPQFQTEIGAQMQAALISEGLFADEAKAMVNTWTDSWFTEDGVRVLYLLPRPWTDETLPMILNPLPTDLTRVMVGRAEIITPGVETNLFQLLTKAQNGDTGARDQASVELKKLGRFAEPALRLASAHANQTNVLNFGNQLLYPPPSATFE